MGGDEEEDENAEEGGGGGGGIAVDDSNVYKIDPDLAQTTGGVMPTPHAPDPTKMGIFTYQEFESLESLFFYVQ